MEKASDFGFGLIDEHKRMADKLQTADYFISSSDSCKEEDICVNYSIQYSSAQNCGVNQLFYISLFQIINVIFEL